MSKFNAGPAVHLLISQLADSVGLNSSSILSVDYSPPVDADIALRIRPGERVPDLKGKYVVSSEILGVFVNVRLSADFVDLFDKARAEDSPRRRVAIEHTSLVPVYPINIATLRSSIIGEWYRRCFELQGNDAIAHHWVQETARQMDLVESELHICEPDDHFDHTVGRRFASRLLNLPEERFTQLFPFAYEVRQNQNPLERPLTRNQAVDAVTKSWRETFGRFEIRCPQFDSDENVLAAFNDERLTLESDPDAILTRGLLQGSGNNEKRLSYFERTILYYCFLLRNSDLATSIVPIQQMALCEAAAAAAVAMSDRTSDSLQIIGYGPVFIDNELDRIRDLRFHSADAYLNEGEPSDDLIPKRARAMRERVLRSRPQTPIHLDTGSWHRERGRTFTGTQHLGLPSVRAILLEDELDTLFEGAIATGDFARIQRWCDEASQLLSRAEASAELPNASRLRHSVSELGA